MDLVLDPGTAAAAPHADLRAFHRLLANTLVTGVTSTFVWFALTFWAYLETRSVVTTAVIGAAFSLASAVLGPAYGGYVDRHRKAQAIRLATVVSAGAFAAATALFLAVDAPTLLSFRRPWFWLLVALTLLGSVAGQLRGIALSTCVTLLVPEGRRDRANGLVGSVTGVSFAVTSVGSGLVIGLLGMGAALYASLALTLAALVHLRTISIPEDEPAPSVGPVRAFDVRRAVAAIAAVPGLPVLVGLAAVNNLLGGVFMALLDAYGLGIVSVETWGALWGVISLGFIAGGLFVARFGLGSRPVRLVILGNLANWTVCSLFAVRTSMALLVVGMLVWLTLIPVIEAAEQTVLQAAVPFEMQGRVFGFAQLLENAAAPLVSVAIGPFAESVVMPSMTDGRLASWIGPWFGVGPERGLALVFTVAGLLGLAVTVAVRLSRSYRVLAAAPTPAAAA